MDDSDHEALHTALHCDPRFLVATTLVTLLLAGSAFLWQRNISAASHSHRDASQSNRSKGALSNSSLAVRDSLQDHRDGKDSKASRPKERRRRGKDPFKDILKNSKKAKLLEKPSRSGESEDIESQLSNHQLSSSQVSRHTLGHPQPSSSRSLSSSSNRKSPSNIEHVSAYQSSDKGSFTGDDEDDEDDDLVPSSSMPAPSPSPKNCADTSLVPSDTSSFIHKSDSVFPSFIPSSSSSTTNSDSTVPSDSVITPNTSPTLSQSGKTPTLAQVDVSSHQQPSESVVTSVSLPSVHSAQKGSDSWDWDGSALPDVTYRKPPRFRSKSRGSGSVPLSPIPPSVSLDSYHSNHTGPASSLSLSSATTSTLTSHDDPCDSSPLSNSPSNPSSSSPASPHPTRGVQIAQSNVNGSSSTPRRAPTPRRPPTPMSGTSTPPPSLSTQTQLASLRGALEAARLREDKLKTDAERYTKELEMLRWEGAAWRRRETELQAQMHHLVHQIQAYGALFASMSPQPPHHLPPGSNTNGNGSANPPPNGYQFSPPTSNPNSPHLQIPPAPLMLATGMLSSPSMLSPIPMTHASPHSPYYPYPHSPHQHLPLQGQSPHLTNNLYSILFPHPTNAGGKSSSRPSSVAGSSSVGSHSPDLAGSAEASTSSATLDRGRRRTRPQEPGASDAWEGDYRGGWANGEGDSSGEYGGGERHYSDDDDEGVSEVLADAILKRPGSIRGLSKKARPKGTSETETSPPTEFTFPSLSDLGNVNRAFSAAAASPNRETVTVVNPKDESVDRVAKEPEEFLPLKTYGHQLDSSAVADPQREEVTP